MHKAAKPAGDLASPSPDRKLRLLGICGSLRAASVNRTWLQAIRELAPAGIRLELWEGLASMPLFNPDLEPVLPPAAGDLRQRVTAADGLLIASPEYAHGVSGALKNALDWLVGLETFAGTPVAVLNASPRAHHADAALREILVTMGAQLVEPASICLPLLGRGLDVAGICADPSTAVASRALLQDMAEVLAAG